MILKRFILLNWFIFLFFLNLSSFLDAKDISNQSERIKIFVCITPQKYIVDRIGRDFVDVKEMVNPGQCAELFEPTPKKISELSKAKIYFESGFPIENTWIKSLKQSNPYIIIVDLRTGIKPRLLEHHQHENTSKNQENEGRQDPHIWLSPTQDKIQAETICKTLSNIMPEHKVFFYNNLAELSRDLDKIKNEIEAMLNPLKKRNIMIFHPSLGYFTDEFHLKQIPIEIEGKEPSAKSLEQVIQLAKNEGVKSIFIQSQSGQTTAQRIADTVGAKLIFFDPMEYDIISNLKKLADLIKMSCSE